MTDDAQEKPLGLHDGTLRLMPYRPEWPELYQQEARRISRSLPANLCIEIHHIGSTSVEGLAAKPILDIAVTAQAKDEPQVAHALEALGYTDRGERSGRHFIREDRKGVRTHNLHLYPPGDDRMAKQIAFRDALRQDPQAREDYMKIKAALLGGERQDYAPGKTDYIAALLAK